MSLNGQGTKRRRKTADIYNCLSRVHDRYRRQTGRQTDGRQEIANVNMSSRLLKTQNLHFLMLVNDRRKS